MNEFPNWCKNTQTQIWMNAMPHLKYVKYTGNIVLETYCVIYYIVVDFGNVCKILRNNK